MATRAQIAVGGTSTIKLYKHFDGYPDGVMPVLLPAIEHFGGKLDEEYLMFRLAAAFVIAEEITRMAYPETFLSPTPPTTGYGIGERWYADINYAYIIENEQVRILEVLDLVPAIGGVEVVEAVSRPVSWSPSPEARLWMEIMRAYYRGADIARLARVARGDVALEALSL